MVAEAFWGYDENGAGLVAVQATLAVTVPAGRGFESLLHGGHGFTVSWMRSFVVLIKVSMQGIEEFGC
jgi:hypothetical protein